MSLQSAGAAIRTRACLVVAVAVAGIVIGVPAAVPAPVIGAAAAPICANVPPQVAAARGPRIKHLNVAGTPVSVLLPPRYATSNRRYPVLYLLHGGTAGIDSYLADLNLVARPAKLPDSQQFIVVTPYGGLTGFYVDWADGSHHFESQHITQVLPAIDRRYRTIAKRSGRAVAGVSMGGWGAMHYATSHPALFSAVGALSGGLDNQSPDAMVIFLLATQTQRQCEDGVAAGAVDPFGMFGNPVVNAERWRAANPTAHAGRLKGMDVYLAAGDGLPCDTTDLAAIASDPTAAAIEAIVGHTTLTMHLALGLAGVRHAYLPKPCGVHTDRYFGPEVNNYIGHLARLWAR